MAHPAVQGVLQGLDVIGTQAVHLRQQRLDVLHPGQTGFQLFDGQQRVLMAGLSQRRLPGLLPLLPLAFCLGQCCLQRDQSPLCVLDLRFQGAALTGNSLCRFQPFAGLAQGIVQACRGRQRQPVYQRLAQGFHALVEGLKLFFGILAPGQQLQGVLMALQPGRRGIQGQIRQAAGRRLGLPVGQPPCHPCLDGLNVGFDARAFQFQLFQLVGAGLPVRFVLCPFQAGIGQGVGLVHPRLECTGPGGQGGRVGLDGLPVVIALLAGLGHVLARDGLMMTHQLQQRLFLLLDVLDLLLEGFLPRLQRTAIVMLLHPQGIDLAGFGHQHRLQPIDGLSPRPHAGQGGFQRGFQPLPFAGQGIRLDIGVPQPSGLFQQVGECRINAV